MLCLGDGRCRGFGPRTQPVDVETMRLGPGPRPQGFRAPQQQRARTDRVAALRMRDADGELRESAPELAIGLGRLPHGLEDLVRAERLTARQQLVRKVDRVV